MTGAAGTAEMKERRFAYQIERELGANALLISAYSNSMFIGLLVGYRDHRRHTVVLYPHSKIVPGFFRERDFPITVRRDELPWKK